MKVILALIIFNAGFVAGSIATDYFSTVHQANFRACAHSCEKNNGVSSVGEVFCHCNNNATFRINK